MTCDVSEWRRLAGRLAAASWKPLLKWFLSHGGPRTERVAPRTSAELPTSVPLSEISFPANEVAVYKSRKPEIATLRKPVVTIMWRVTQAPARRRRREKRRGARRRKRLTERRCARLAISWMIAAPREPFSCRRRRFCCKSKCRRAAAASFALHEGSLFTQKGNLH